MRKHPYVKLAPGTWVISDYYLANMYLLEGQDSALLIDTGAGLGDLHALVRELTDKPLQVAATHGHLDHVGGNGGFGHVMIHPADRAMADETTTRDNLVDFVASRGSARNTRIPVQELLELLPADLKPFEWLDLADGQIIDLGGRIIEVIHIPGHSLGHVAFIDHGARLAFTGDMCNPILLLRWPETTTTVAGYRDSMLKLQAREADFDALGLGHGSLRTHDSGIIEQYIEACDHLLNGSAKATPSHPGLHQGVSYQWKRVRIFFDPERLR